MVLDWDEDSSRLLQNIEDVARAARDHARSRGAPSLSIARAWHRQIMDGLDFPPPAEDLEAGVFRGEPGQTHVAVDVGGQSGVPPDRVAAELERFEAKLIRAVGRLDARVPSGGLPDEEALDMVLDLCAWVHAEWVRIHPFPNGNGRTARLWANWVVMRYGLPPFVRLRPRPEGDAYAFAGACAMSGDWRPTAALFRGMLLRFLDEQSA